ncbi:MAG: DUF4347 domain-containing protein, partial [Mesorhizobium sp.]
MARASELLFVDPSISDLQTVLGNLRPEVRAVVLNSGRPPAQQIAAALDGHKGLDAVHIIAHGAPGRVQFAAGEWSAATLKESDQDFAAIGKALAADGQLRLWSCSAALGNVGERFLEALEEAVGAEVCASRSLVGAANLGGSWGLPHYATSPLPPITSAGVANYSGVLESGDLTLAGFTDAGSSKSINTYYLIDTNNTATIADDTIVGTFVLNSSANGVAPNFAVTITVPDITHTYLIYDSGFRQYGTLSPVADVDLNTAGDQPGYDFDTAPINQVG